MGVAYALCCLVCYQTTTKSQ